MTVEFSRLRKFTALAGVASLALVAAGCSGGGDKAASADNPVTLTVTTFGTFGYDDLYAEYEKQNPGITIKATNIDRGSNARTDAFTKLAAGSGLSDVTAIEEGWLGSIMEVSDQFVDLKEYGAEDIKGNWVDWKFEQGTDPRWPGHRIRHRHRTAGPVLQRQALRGSRPAERPRRPSPNCSAERTQAGTPTSSSASQYKEATGKAWYDQSGFVWNSMVNQMDEGYYTKDGKLNVEGNSGNAGKVRHARCRHCRWPVRQPDPVGLGQRQGIRRRLLRHVRLPGLDARHHQGPARVRRRRTPPAAGTSPTSSPAVRPTGAAHSSPSPRPPSTLQRPQSWQLADRTRAAGQAVRCRQQLPEHPRRHRQRSSEAAKPNELFNNAPSGAILASRAEGVVAQFKGPDDSVIQENVFGPALKMLDSGQRRPPMRPGMKPSASSTTWSSTTSSTRPWGLRDQPEAPSWSARPTMTTTMNRTGGRQTGRPQTRNRTFRQRLNVFDVKASPYFYVAPFFILFAFVGLFPLVYTFLVSPLRLAPAQGPGRVRRTRELR